jgi:protein involved in polysaccharide export with SLBB domain
MMPRKIGPLQIGRLALLFAATLGLAACSDSVFSTTQSLRPVEQHPERFAAWTDAIPPYEFESGDKIRVQFMLTPEMSEDAVVGPDGRIGLRSAGQLQAAGQTAVQLQAAIEQAALRTLSQPIVTVSLVDSPGTPIFVGGQVGKPGPYFINGRRGSFEAVQLAGGFSPEARMNEVVLIRRNPQDLPMLRTVDLRSFVDGTNTQPDLPLVPGDIVFVPRNRISEVDLWVDQFINRFIPFSKGFSYSVNKTGAAY